MGHTGATLPRFHRPRTVRFTASALAVLAGVTAARSVRRVVVVGGSMAPALLAGDRLVVVGRPFGPPAWPEPGAVVAVRDPRDRSRVLVKRVARVDRASGTLEVLGDAAERSSDSRIFGPVARSALVGRAVYRYAPPGRSSRGPWPGEYDRSDAQPQG